MTKEQIDFIETLTNDEIWHLLSNFTVAISSQNGQTCDINTEVIPKLQCLTKEYRDLKKRKIEAASEELKIAIDRLLEYNMTTQELHTFIHEYVKS